MKRIISLTVAAVMILSLIPVMAVTASAAQADGSWDTLRRPADYFVDEEAGETYKPAPGYEYTAEGFTIVPADYTNQTVYFNIQTKDPQPVKEGIYLRFRVDDYCYAGPDNSADAWIGLSLWDSVNLQPGNTSYGAGWVALLRGSGDGSSTAQSFASTPSSEDVTGQFIHQGDVAFDVPMDDGREIYTLEVQWTGAAYDIRINGVAVPGAAEGVTQLLEQQSPTGDLYVGISFHSTFAGGTGACTILAYGTSEATATVPVGDDSKDPEGNIVIFEDPIDPSTVPEGQPALLWDATKTSFRGDAYGAGASYTAQGDDSYHVKAVDANPNAMWHIKNTLTYMAEDFPVLAILTRNFWGSGGSLYYCAGDVLAAQDSSSLTWSLYDDFNEEIQAENGDVYNLILIDLTDLWSGRIHGYQPHFTVGDYSDPEQGEFDICWMGSFRTGDEAFGYFENYLRSTGVIEGEITEEETTEAPDEALTGIPTEEITELPTEPPTEAPTDEAPETDPPKSGCGGALGFGAAAVLSAAAALAALKKRD